MKEVVKKIMRNLMRLVFYAILFAVFLIPVLSIRVLACWNNSECPTSEVCNGADFPNSQGSCGPSDVSKICTPYSPDSCSACSASCGGGTYSCTNGCDTWTSPCNNQPCCTNTAPSQPINLTPVDGSILRVGSAQVLNWDDIASWGTNCSGNSDQYLVCVSSNQTSCDVLNNVSAGATSQYSWTPTTGDPYATWQVTATNGIQQTASVVRSVCVEGFNSGNTNYVSAWSSCDANHRRTRTCKEDCGTDDCAAFTASNDMAEDCKGSIRGTLFDASDQGICPAFNPATGWITGLDPELLATNHTFGLADQSAVAPHPWSILSPITTNGNGNYAITVYAPATYTYDFSALADIYAVSDGPKLTCTAASATVPSNPTGCLVQPCTLVNNMSFGFWKKYGSWWQVQGGSVHAEEGLTNVIPSSLLTEMSALLPDDVTGDHTGFVSYGQPKGTYMLGRNPNAKVSALLWEKESRYGGSVYDWGYFNTRFNLFPRTAWTEGDPINYDDGGRGYQIFKSSTSVTSFDYNPTGTQKIIFHIKGDVTVTNNVTIPNGAFMAVIASGNITFATNVTRADGWYVGKTISVPCIDLDSNGCDETDQRFLGNGSFIGWSGISLNRHRGVTNNTESPHLFTYRQDLYQATPKPLKIYEKHYRPFIP